MYFEIPRRKKGNSWPLNTGDGLHPARQPPERMLPTKTAEWLRDLEAPGREPEVLMHDSFPKGGGETAWLGAGRKEERPTGKLLLSSPVGRAVQICRGGQWLRYSTAAKCCGGHPHHGRTQDCRCRVVLALVLVFMLTSVVKLGGSIFFSEIDHIKYVQLRKLETV